MCFDLRLGLPTPDNWHCEARNRRNRLVRADMIDPADPARPIEDLTSAKGYSVLMMATSNRVRLDAMTRMGHKTEYLSEELSLPGQRKCI